MHTIRVTGDYVVTADQTLNFNGVDAFLLQQKHGSDPNLTNYGAVRVSGSSWDGVTGVSAPYGDYDYHLTVLNAAGASFDISADSGDAYGFDVTFGKSDLTNEGALTVTAGQGVAIGVVGRDDTLVSNDGQVTVQGVEAYGVRLYGGGRPIENSGVWTVVGADKAIGFDLMEGHGAVNSGTLAVTGGSGGAVGMQFGSNFYGLALDNRGQITAIDTDHATASVGVLFYGAWHGYNEAAEIDNAGRIQGDYAIREVDGSDDALALTLRNSGRLIGTVALADGADALFNTGTIRGDVDLGNGDDSYDGARGRLDGALFGGIGDDTLAGGKGKDVIWGDAGDDGGQVSADLISGGKGGDQLHGEGGDDTLAGGAGADILSGGYGKDVFAYASVGDSAAGHADLITDLGKYDVIDLGLVDANANVAGDQAFVLVDHLDGHPGELTLSYDGASKTTTLAGDVDGDGAADLVIAISGDHHDFTTFVL